MARTYQPPMKNGKVVDPRSVGGPARVSHIGKVFRDLKNPYGKQDTNNQAKWQDPEFLRKLGQWN